MARRSVPPRKGSKRTARARAPRVVEICGLAYPLVKGCITVDGHVLGPQQIKEFKSKAETRLATQCASGSTTPVDSEYWARQIGLDDLLFGYKPSKRASERIAELARELSNLALSIGGMSKFLFWENCARATGCKALLELVAAAETPLMRLRWLANTMARQDEEKLQDWMTHEEYYATIGNAPGHQVQS